MPSKKQIIIYSLIIILSILFFKFILYPAHISVVASCNPDKFKEEYPTYHIIGSFSVNYTNETEPVITTYLKEEEDIPTKMHELAHKRQFEGGYLFNCRFASLKLLNECDAYIIQRYWEIKELFN